MDGGRAVGGGRLLMVRTLTRDGADLGRWLEACERRLAAAGAGPAWLARRRRAAVDRLAAAGFPDRHDEAWRRTDTAPVVRLAPAELPPADRVALRRALDAVPPVADAFRLVVVDGRFAPELSDDEPDAALRAGGLARLLADDPAALEPTLARDSPPAWPEDPFADAATALLGDGAAVVVPADTVVAAPLHVVFVSSRPGTGAVRAARLVVRLGRGSELHLVETHVGPAGPATDVPSATLAVTELELGAGAVLERVRVQREAPGDLHLGRTVARLGRDATLRSRLVVLGARASRDDTSVLLDGEGASCELHGLYALDGDRRADCQTTVDHARPHGTSRQLYRGVLRDRAAGAFDGGVAVRAGARGTDAAQTNDVLLLSREARTNTKPSLEILADDVACRHGATVGELDRDAIFYLRSRGLAEADARHLLVRGFAAAALDRPDDEGLRALLEALVEEAAR